jgi:hypothetical protein
LSSGALTRRRLPLAGSIPDAIATDLEGHWRRRKARADIDLPQFVERGVVTMPRDAAIAHEAGHAIVAAHEGQIFRSVNIESRSVPGFGMVWSGWCSADGTWTSGPDTTAESDLSRARIVIAGLVAEHIARTANPGSSIDERSLSLALASNAANKLYQSPAEFKTFAERLWREQVLGFDYDILCANLEPFQQLRTQLNEREKVKGGKLRAILAKVRRIAS